MCCYGLVGSAVESKALYLDETCLLDKQSIEPLHLQFGVLFLANIANHEIAVLTQNTLMCCMEYFECV